MSNPNGETVVSQEPDEIVPADQVQMIKTEESQIARQIENLKITNRESYEKAGEVGLWNKNMIDRIEALRVAIVKPFNDQIKNINQIFKDLAKPFTANDDILRTGINRYIKSVKRDPIQNVNTQMGRMTIQERAIFEVIDPDKVPREYLKVDEAKIGRAVRAGVVTEIPGVKIETQKSVSLTVQK